MRVAGRLHKSADLRQSEADLVWRRAELASIQQQPRETLTDADMGLGRALRSVIPRIEARCAELRRKIEAARGLHFTNEQDRFLHGTLLGIRAELEVFHGGAGLRANMVDRLRWARNLRERMAGEWHEAWVQAIAGVARSPKYGGLQLAAKMDLVPIGVNPSTGLWEFYHPRSGTDGHPIPAHDHDGKLTIGEETGLVFVLMPAGTFWMGAQRPDPAARNYDPQAEDDEAPVHEVMLSAFFLSRFEMTQGQWQRLSRGERPSYYHAGHGPGSPRKVTLAHPVEQVSWVDCDRLLQHHGLVLPTEAQWEYACRVGTQTPWCSGATVGSLHGHANVLDESGSKAVAAWGAGEAFDDGQIVHAPVGSFAPNAFGLLDLHGNVWEWCLDTDEGYGIRPRARDGLRDTGELAQQRVLRGGSFGQRADRARSANRDAAPPAARNAPVGVRPAARIVP
jgi:formylglycine-generating enzyme required for sulfatase activity